MGHSYTKVKDNVVRVDSFSSGGQYYITAHLCPHCNDLLWVCSCPSFQMGIARMGKNPLKIPCKHIEAFWKDEPRTHIQILMNFGKVAKSPCKVCGKKILYKVGVSGRKRLYCSRVCKDKAYRNRKNRKNLIYVF